MIRAARRCKPASRKGRLIPHSLAGLLAFGSQRPRVAARAQGPRSRDGSLGSAVCAGEGGRGLSGCTAPLPHRPGALDGAPLLKQVRFVLKFVLEQAGW